MKLMLLSRGKKIRSEISLQLKVLISSVPRYCTQDHCCMILILDRSCVRGIGGIVEQICATIVLFTIKALKLCTKLKHYMP